MGTYRLRDVRLKSSDLLISLYPARYDTDRGQEIENEMAQLKGDEDKLAEDLRVKRRYATDNMQLAIGNFCKVVNFT